MNVKKVQGGEKPVSKGGEWQAGSLRNTDPAFHDHDMVPRLGNGAGGGGSGLVVECAACRNGRRTGGGGHSSNGFRVVDGR